MAEKKNTIRKILVANRGEIACRVMRTARDLGIRTVAVYSEPDAAARHVAMADEAVLIGPGPVGQSYLVAEKILDAAQQTRADAVHPGYGFLSENADFSAAVEKAGLTFIGPTAEAIDLMGNKAAAKRRMIEADVPCVPGYEGEDQSDKVLVKEGKKVGFPIMVSNHSARDQTPGAGEISLPTATACPRGANTRPSKQVRGPQRSPTGKIVGRSITAGKATMKETIQQKTIKQYTTAPPSTNTSCMQPHHL